MLHTLLRLWLLLVMASAPLIPSAHAKITIQAYNTPPFTPNVTHQQDFCQLHRQIHLGEVGLRDALKGVALRPVFSVDHEGFVHYSDETGIDPDDPGILVLLMDELSRRAGFTWRESFAVVRLDLGEQINVTYTDILLWGIETYDVSVSWWDQSVERMEQGVTFIEPWFDGSIILIDKVESEDHDKVKFFNWTKPFEWGVWLLIIVTLFLSTGVFLLIEYLNNGRQRRSFGQWFQDSLYLSALNFTQQYEYAPNSLSGRVFGVSMAFWALIIIATYTANLASLFVEDKIAQIPVETVPDAIKQGIPICVYAHTNAHFLLQKKYKDAKLVPKGTELEAYNALNRGECGLYAGYKDNWLSHQPDRLYNQDCDLEWIGRTVQIIKSGFGCKADAGHKCTSLVRDVLNLHMVELIADGFLQHLWDSMREEVVGTVDSCVAGQRVDRRLSPGYSSQPAPPTRIRRARQVNNQEATLTLTADDNNKSLTPKQMAGTFLLNYMFMILSVIIAFIEKYVRRHRQQNAGQQEPIQKTYRKHGPIIGSPPPLNTFASCVPEEEKAPNNHHQQTCNEKDFTAEMSSNAIEAYTGRFYDDSSRLASSDPQSGRHLDDMDLLVTQDDKMDMILSILQKMHNSGGSYQKEDKTA